jgi:hypothetical protein
MRLRSLSHLVLVICFVSSACFLSTGAVANVAAAHNFFSSRRFASTRDPRGVISTPVSTCRAVTLRPRIQLASACARSARPQRIFLAGRFHPVRTSQWAGYFETPGPVEFASATWIVPRLRCSDKETLSSTWVGIGGLAGGSLLQAGMYDNCIAGHAVNGGFAEQYPGSTASFDVVAEPGDRITATVDRDARGWSATVVDRTTGQSGTSSAPGYRGGASAEWMAEAYGAAGGVPMTDFGSERLLSFTVDRSPAEIPIGDVYETADVRPSDPARGVYRLTFR